jgi:hypothetical protein
MDALKDFPDFDTKLVTEKGDAICQKQDIFKGLIWFAYTNNFANWHVLNIEQVKEILAENKLKNKVSSLEDFAIETVVEQEKNFNNAMGQESLTRFDQPKKKKRSNKKSKQGVEGNVRNNRPAITSNNNTEANKNKPSGNNNRPNNNKRPNPNQKSGEPRKPIIITKNEDKK